MKTYFCISVLIFGLCGTVQAKETNLRQKPKEEFSDAEDNFKFVMQKLLDRYIDSHLAKSDLYRAATAGMLESLNSGGQNSNKLLSPGEFKDIRADLSGQVSGIGAELKFDTNTGYAQILRVLSQSPGERAGLKKDDQILSVDGLRYKGKEFVDLVAAIRGKPGGAVQLKVLRDDRILHLTVRRAMIPWTPVELSRLGDATGLLTIGYFTEETPRLVEEKIREVNESGDKRLIVDLRDNSGGGFEQAIRVAGLFVPKGNVVAITNDRDNQTEKLTSSSGLLKKDIHVILLTNKGTFCGAELLVAAVRENRDAKIVGEATFGKWNAQTIETLPNGYAIKYTVKAFESPKGHSYQESGFTPDLEVPLAKDIEPRELRLKYEVSERMAFDTQLKAAFELAKAM